MRRLLYSFCVIYLETFVLLKYWSNSCPLWDSTIDVIYLSLGLGWNIMPINQLKRSANSIFANHLKSLTFYKLYWILVRTECYYLDWAINAQFTNIVVYYSYISNGWRLGHNQNDTLHEIRWFEFSLIPWEFTGCNSSSWESRRLTTWS